MFLDAQGRVEEARGLDGLRVTEEWLATPGLVRVAD